MFGCIVGSILIIFKDSINVQQNLRIQEDTHLDILQHHIMHEVGFGWAVLSDAQSADAD